MADMTGSGRDFTDVRYVGGCVYEDEYGEIEPFVWHRDFNGGSTAPVYVMKDASNNLHFVEAGGFGMWDWEDGRITRQDYPDTEDLLEEVFRVVQEKGEGTPLFEIEFHQRMAQIEAECVKIHPSVLDEIRDVLKEVEVVLDGYNEEDDSPSVQHALERVNSIQERLA